jgi:3-oxoadipate enol-lactonase
MAFYRSRGLNLHYEVAGVGPAVLLVHGFTNFGLVWGPQIAALAYSGYRVIVPDLAGHGLSAPVEAVTDVPALASDMVALLDVLGIDRVVVCGLSLGGMVAQQMAIDHPQRAAALVVADSRADNNGMQAMVERWIAEFEGPGGPLGRLDKTYPMLLNEAYRSSVSGQATLDLWRLVLSQVTGRSLASVARGMLGFDVTAGLPAVDAPTLVISGEEDRLIPPALSQRSAELIHGARFEIIPEAGHISSLDSAAAFNQLLLAFLADPAVASRLANAIG